MPKPMEGAAVQATRSSQMGGTGSVQLDFGSGMRWVRGSRPFWRRTTGPAPPGCGPPSRGTPRRPRWPSAPGQFTRRSQADVKHRPPLLLAVSFRILMNIFCGHCRDQEQWNNGVDLSALALGVSSYLSSPGRLPQSPTQGSVRCHAAKHASSLCSRARPTVRAKLPLRPAWTPETASCGDRKESRT